ncbi:expressed unknown protein [Seminavis robusta]|uniref:Uncharacterized protein n=1 Tax=Seminavis robusta TaxID=568900 RepID=A0A9N8H9S0_9STRA|nr:expressed unknown protein [Seminavis robusta]|eukprot:Sro289_g109040.1 n/a (256) ;mRNA; r:21989-22756
MPTVEAPTGSPRVGALTKLPEDVLAVGLRNDKKRFFVPSGDNSFAGIAYQNVMIDSGCNSLLLPFPQDGISALTAFQTNEFFWEISWSAGVGVINPPSLLIYCQETNEDVGNLVLADRQVVPLKMLRFHLGSASARTLLDSGILVAAEATKLEQFLADLDPRVSDERNCVLLGQAVFSQVFSLQAGKLLLIAKRGYFPVKEDFRAAWSVIRSFEGQGLMPNNFHDLDDEDHNGDIISAWSDEFEGENWEQGYYKD